MTTTLEEQVAALVDRQAVVDALHRYAAAIDRCARDRDDAAFEAYEQTMTEDCVVDYGPLGCFDSRDEWMGFARYGLAERGGLCHHMYANIFVDIDGDTARAQFHAQALHYWDDQPPGQQVLHAVAIFQDELRRTPDGWKLCKVQPNVQFVNDPCGGVARMFPDAAG